MKKKRFYNFLFLVFFLITLTVQSKTSYGERIIRFHSDILVDTTGRVLVTEKIKFNVTGESINRGIVRSIPIYRKNIKNKKERVDINILLVTRNGLNEDYTTKRVGDNFEIYIGNKDRTLSHDIHEYTIAYESYGHVGFFEDYDEIYWNVTGNDWSFRIDSASATIYVPYGAAVLSNSCYTGVSGSTASDCLYELVGDSIVKFYARKSLSLNEGFTVATSFTPFVIDRTPPPPSKAELYRRIIASFAAGIALLSTLVYLFRYSFTSLKKLNLTREKFIVIPNFNPPEGRSPATVRYLFKRKVDPKMLTAAVLSMAVKGVISIKNGRSNYEICKENEPINLSEEEMLAYNHLFTDGANVALLTKSYSSLWSKIYNACCSLILGKENIEAYYPNKIKLVVDTGVISVITFVLSLITLYFAFGVEFEDIVPIVFVCGFATLFIYVCLKLGKSCLTYIIAFFFLFSNFCIIVLGIMHGESWQRCCYIIFILILIFNLIYYRKVSRETLKGAKLKADLHGFKMYLKIAEEDRLNFLTPPEQTPAQFEKMLPYAVALDLEIDWAKKFSSILKQYNYTPTWCEAGSIESYTDFTRSLSTTLTQAMSTNITRVYSSSSSSSSGGSSRPRSSGSSSWSSGSRGRGSSGGGGGGGGGRGW